MSYKTDFINLMVRSGVLSFGDFTLKSGRKSPYFINTGHFKTGAQMARLGECYAACVQDHLPGRLDALFGPAYKGIPLAVTCAVALANRYNRDVSYCFNRKEAKDHGEGGVMVGCKLSDGDRIAIIDDVTTAGTVIRECLPLLKEAADVDIAGLGISVDRMERGTGDLSAVQQIEADYGIKVYPIVSVRDIIDSLHNVPVDGRVLLDDAMRGRMEAYLAEYGAEYA